MAKFLYTLTIIITLNGQCRGQYSEEFQKIVQCKSCENLVNLVKTNWKYNSKKDYYESKFSVDEKGTKEIQLPCIKGINSKDIKVLFGEPNNTFDNYWQYNTTPLDENDFADTYLTIEFKYGRLKMITTTNCTGTVDYIKENWKYQSIQNYYETSFTPNNQGMKEVKIPCIEHIDRQQFHKIFGKPNLSFTRTALVPMQKVEWNDKGKEIKPKPIDNHIIIDRYYISSYSIDNYETNLLEVTFYPAVKTRQAFNKIVTKNCQNIIDTLKSSLIFNDTLGYYQYQKKNEHEQIKDALLYSSCLYSIDSSTVRKFIGNPSAIIKENEWEYRMSDYFNNGKYTGHGFRFYYSIDGTLSNIDYIYSIPLISPEY